MNCQEFLNFVSCYTSTPIKQSQVISGKGGAHPLHPFPRSTPVATLPFLPSFTNGMLVHCKETSQDQFCQVPITVLWHPQTRLADRDTVRGKCLSQKQILKLDPFALIKEYYKEYYHDQATVSLIDFDRLKVLHLIHDKRQNENNNLYLIFRI